MKTNPAKEIEKLKRQIASLEAKAVKSAAKKQKSDKRKVTALARKLGYKSAENLFASLFGNSAMAAASAPAGKKRKRARLTDDDRKAIIADLKSRTFSAAQVAKKHGVSVPTVNLIKKAAGLTKSRKAARKPVGKKSAATEPAASA